MHRDNPSWNCLPANPLLAQPFSTNQQTWLRYCCSFSEIEGRSQIAEEIVVFSIKVQGLLCFVLVKSSCVSEETIGKPLCRHATDR